MFSNNRFSAFQQKEPKYKSALSDSQCQKSKKHHDKKKPQHLSDHERNSRLDHGSYSSEENSQQPVYSHSSPIQFPPRVIPSDAPHPSQPPFQVYVQRKRKNKKSLRLASSENDTRNRLLAKRKDALRYDDGTEKLFQSGGSSDEDKSWSVKHLFPATPKMFTDTEDEIFKGFYTQGLRQRHSAKVNSHDKSHQDSDQRDQQQIQNSDTKRGSFPLSLNELKDLNPQESRDSNQPIVEGPISATSILETTAFHVDSNMESEKKERGIEEIETIGIWDYFKGEFAMNEVDKAQDIKTERLLNFFQTPFELEKLLLLGYFVCFDSFLTILTILPIRFIMSLWSLIQVLLRRKSYVIASQKCDLIKGVIVVLCCYFLQYVDASRIYHSIRGQAVIKLAVIYNVSEILDRLCCSFGQDILDSLFSVAAASTDSKIAPYTTSHLKPLPHFVVGVLYICTHTIVLFYQVVTMNVAINSYSSSLLTLLLSNQFVEIKGSVFKKFEKENLFQLSCSDIVERFQLTLFLCIISIRNMMDASLSESFVSQSQFLLFLPVPSRRMVDMIIIPFVAVMGSEVLIDWLKHAFITKFNHIRGTVYSKYVDILCKDLVGDAPRELIDQKKRNYIDHSPLVARRVGFAPIPLVCLCIRFFFQAILLLFNNFFTWGKCDESDKPSWTVIFSVIFFGYVVLFLLKMTIGVTILRYAIRRYNKDKKQQQKEFEEKKNLSDTFKLPMEKDKSSSLEGPLPKSKQLPISLDNIDRFTLFKSRIP